MTEHDARQRVESLCDVSRETMVRLDHFVGDLRKWNAKINLVSPSTLPNVWQRHILDSAQLFPLIGDESETLCDIGTGGGFPGAVLAILSQQTIPRLNVAMIESDRRKCAFLQQIKARQALSSQVIPERIEKVEPLSADVMTSRALAPLKNLLGYAHRHLSPDGRAIFLKGAKYQAEIDEALDSWWFELQERASETSADAVVLEISNLRPRD